MDSRRITDNSIDKEYFESYDDFQVHESILRDRPCINAFYDAIMSNKHLFENKVIY